MRAAVALATTSDSSGSAAARRRTETEAVKAVAHYLGNTPAVCPASYIDPRVFDRYQSGSTIAAALDGRGEAFGLERESACKLVEEAVIDLITEPDDSPLITSEAL